MNIQLPTGKTVHISIVEFLALEDNEVGIFYQELMADDSGDFLENPFSPLRPQRDIQIETPDVDEDISI